METKKLVVPLALIGLTLGVVSVSHGARPSEDPEGDRVIRGFQIAPVHLTLRNRDRNLVGLGSYIVNAQGGCNDCHTNPSYAPGHDPYQEGSRSRSMPRGTWRAASSSAPSSRGTSRLTSTVCPPD